MRKPTKEDLAAAVSRTVPDVIAERLRVLFCGINPGLYSAATRHHFARPGNRFWPALFDAGFTPRLLRPWEEKALLKYGCGVTNIVGRATAAAHELTTDELLRGKKRLARKAARYRPRYVAVLGIGAYRTAFSDPDAEVGLQEQLLPPARLWVLPNPSGLNAHYRPHELVKIFADLREAAEA